MNIKFSYFRGTDALLNVALDIRKEVFVMEQNIDPALEFDGYDKSCTHYVGYVDDIPVAASRVRLTGEGIKLERFAVLKSHRNKGIGRLLLERILRDALSFHEVIYLNSQVSALDFYKHNGFEVAGGNFFEAGIEHYKMIFKG